MTEEIKHAKIKDISMVPEGEGTGSIEVEPTDEELVAGYMHLTELDTVPLNRDGVEVGRGHVYQNDMGIFWKGEIKAEFIGEFKEAQEALGLSVVDENGLMEINIKQTEESRAHEAGEAPSEG